MKELHTLSRTELLIGDEGLVKLQKSNILLFGVGGVGSYATEALVRSGIGNITVVDGDEVSLTNLNRQLIATHSTIGTMKTTAVKNRIKDIMPNMNVTDLPIYYTKDNENEIDFTKYNYIIDCIDMVTSKLMIIEKAKKLGIPIISSMGTGNKFHPEMFEVTDISKTSVCPLAKVMRKELKNRRISKVKVVYSKELPKTPENSPEQGKRQIPGSMSFVPPVAGMILASEVVRDLLGIK